MYEETIAGLRMIVQDYKRRLTPYMRMTICKAANVIEEMSRDLNSAGQTIADLTIEKAVCGETRWIPVTERLPEHEYGESTSVLTVDLYGVMRVTYFDGGNWCWPTGEALTTMRVAPITHWMPLPKPPQEET